MGNLDLIWAKIMQPYIFLKGCKMIKRNIRQFSKKIFYRKLMKTFKKSCFHNLILYFLSKVITRVDDIGAYFIEYVMLFPVK